MSQDDTPTLPPAGGEGGARGGGAARPAAPVTRLNRRTLAILAGGLSVAVLGALMWSLQPQRRGANEQAELYNVDRVSKSEGLDGLPADYSKLPPAVPELGPPLPGDLGPAIVRSKQPVTAAYAAPGHDPNDALRKEAEAAAASSVFFRSGAQRPRRWRSRRSPPLGPRRQCGVRPAGGWAGLDGGPACRPDRRTEPARPERGFPERWFHGNP